MLEGMITVLALYSEHASISTTAIMLADKQCPMQMLLCIMVLQDGMITVLALCSGASLNFHNCHHVSRQIMHKTNATIHIGALKWDDNHFSTLQWSLLQFPQLQSCLRTNDAQCQCYKPIQFLLILYLTMHFGALGWNDDRFSTLQWSKLSISTIAILLADK